MVGRLAADPRKRRVADQPRRKDQKIVGVGWVQVLKKNSMALPLLQHKLAEEFGERFGDQPPTDMTKYQALLEFVYYIKEHIPEKEKALKLVEGWTPKMSARGKLVWSQVDLIRYEIVRKMVLG